MPLSTHDLAAAVGIYGTTPHEMRAPALLRAAAEC